MNSGPHISNYSGLLFPADLPWKLFDYGILESPWKTLLLEYSQLSSVEPKKFASGVLFGKTAELRWKKRRNGQFYLVLIGEAGVAPLDELAVVALKRLGVGQYGLPQQIFLWGEPHGSPAGGQWYEAGIPRLIDEYPKSLSGGRVIVRLAHYILKETTLLPGERTEPSVAILSRSVGLGWAATEAHS